jgi:hypothetical protein
MAAKLPHAQSEPDSKPALDRDAPQEKGVSRRFVVRIERRACRLLDTADNLKGSCKALIDQLRYAGLIPDDGPESPVEIEITQTKATKKAAQGTWVAVTEIDS